MRAAGCAFNDIVDRDIDAQVARTAAAPDPSGRISVKQAWAFVVGCSLISLLILLTLNLTARPAGRRVAGAGRGLSLHEADHLVAPGLAGPDLQLGRPDGLCGRDRRPLRFSPGSWPVRRS